MPVCDIFAKIGKELNGGTDSTAKWAGTLIATFRRR
jgi:hypothetical protein